MWPVNHSNGTMITDSHSVHLTHSRTLSFSSLFALCILDEHIEWRVNKSVAHVRQLNLSLVCSKSARKCNIEIFLKFNLRCLGSIYFSRFAPHHLAIRISFVSFSLFWYMFGCCCSFFLLLCFLLHVCVSRCRLCLCRLQWIMNECISITLI